MGALGGTKNSNAANVLVGFVPDDYTSAGMGGAKFLPPELRKVYCACTSAPHVLLASGLKSQPRHLYVDMLTQEVYRPSPAAVPADVSSGDSCDPARSPHRSTGRRDMDGSSRETLPTAVGANTPYDVTPGPPIRHDAPPATLPLQAPTLCDFRGGLFCDEPGLGKTVTGLALILRTRDTWPQLPRGARLVRNNGPGGKHMLSYVAV